jgi:HEAT repeat protein
MWFLIKYLRIKRLINALGDDDSRASALGSLVFIGKSAVKQLIAVLKHNRDRLGRRSQCIYILMYAVKALGDIKDIRAIDPLIALLDDVDPNVREEVINALVKIGKPTVEPLIVALNEEHSCVRWGAAKALGQIKDLRAIEPLFAVLQTIPLCSMGDEMNVRWCLIWALAELKDNRLVEQLIELLKSKETVARWAAASYLYSITGQKFGEEAAKWQEWWEENKEIREKR